MSKPNLIVEKTWKNKKRVQLMNVRVVWKGIWTSALTRDDIDILICGVRVSDFRPVKGRRAEGSGMLHLGHAMKRFAFETGVSCHFFIREDGTGFALPTNPDEPQWRAVESRVVEEFRAKKHREKYILPRLKKAKPGQLLSQVEP